MPTLRELQRHFGTSILTGRTDTLEDIIVDDDIAAADRLCIYRNTARVALTEGLRLSYPAIDRLVGEAFFDMAAARFIAAHPATSGYLNTYGQGFPAFLETMQETAGCTYLGEVGRYEWALAIAANAPDAGTIDLKALAAVDPDLLDGIRFIPHPSVSLLRLAVPADEIADAVLGGDPGAMAEVDLSTGPVFLVVHRDDDGIQVERLREDVHSVLQALFEGRPLGALSGSDDTDVAHCLAEQFAKGRLAGFIDRPGGKPMERLS